MRRIYWTFRWFRSAYSWLDLLFDGVMIITALLFLGWVLSEVSK